MANITLSLVKFIGGRTSLGFKLKMSTPATTTSIYPLWTLDYTHQEVVSPNYRRQLLTLARRHNL